MKNKKIIFLSVVVLLAAAGCSNKKSDAKTSTSSSTSISSTKSSTASTTNSTIPESEIDNNSDVQSSDVQNSENDQNGETGSNAQQPTITDGDLDIQAINNGDFSTLVGTWKNGKGNIITINADGTTNGNMTIKAVKDSDKTSKVPYVGISNGETGAAIGLFKIGFKNPDGDQSDSSKPRLIITQSSNNFPADEYYYRSSEEVQAPTENTSQNNADLDISAINNGDFSTLVGTWKNGKGNLITINADGTTNKYGSLHAVKDSDKTSKIPYVGINGAAIGLFKIGFKNPDGDQSDSNKPRLIIAQNGGNYPADEYYYRQ
ncbi:hypothetical protein BG262_03060 [Floricoccus penangensis]|uniref:DUF6287 domain-containing protein n=1 Tax=Floricoccus penangensis TaxID=1859475 RepID=A0A9Q5P0C6_9LACT|nr:DUF6287 domain-containing protein [Floricoccus penangensis]OFI46791.1 hypothetical protein BG262_03060 [Floricoccus penangensis]